MAVNGVYVFLLASVILFSTSNTVPTVWKFADICKLLQSSFHDARVLDCANTNLKELLAVAEIIGSLGHSPFISKDPQIIGRSITADIKEVDPLSQEAQEEADRSRRQVKSNDNEEKPEDAPASDSDKKNQFHLGPLPKKILYNLSRTDYDLHSLYKSLLFSTAIGTMYEKEMERYFS